MADLSITVANVAKSTNAQTATGTAGATITAGQPVYLDTTVTPNKYKLADANDSLKYSAAGIALHGALTGQPLTIQTGGDITIGATTAAGSIYIVSATAGGITTTSDTTTFTTGTYPCILGIGLDTTQIRLSITTADVAIP